LQIAQKVTQKAVSQMDGSRAHFTQAIFLLALRLMVENGGIVLHTLDLDILASGFLGSSVLTLFCSRHMQLLQRTPYTRASYSNQLEDPPYNFTGSAGAG
jgi:hypothetical protein